MDNSTPHQVTPQEAQDILKLADFMLTFARVDRATYHPDGQRHETDSDHTVMLAVIACAFASQHLPHLDLGKISQFAIVHDLVEAYAGDTQTMDINQQDYQAKEQREALALDRITQEFGHQFPWIHHTIEDYESLSSAEARYVKTLDKCLPMITHILNRGQVFKHLGVDRAQSQDQYQSSTQAMIDTYAVDQPEIISLRHQIRHILFEVCFNHKQPPLPATE